MAIILKNNLGGRVTFATDAPGGSGSVEPNGGSTTMPKGATSIFWTVEKDAALGSFQTNAVIKNIEDSHVYTIEVTKKAL